MASQATPRQRKRGRQKIWAYIRLFLLITALVLAFYSTWKGQWLGIIALLLVMIFLVDNSVNVLFSIFDEKESRRYGFFFWLYSAFLGTRGIQLVRSDGTKKQVRPTGPLAELFARLGAPGMIIIENGVAAVFERSGRFTRIAGPGVAFTTRYEFVAHVVDLRPQVRNRTILKIITRDGLSFDIDPLTAIFEIAADFDPQKGEYAFSEEALLDLVYRGGFIYENGATVEWGERVVGIIESFLRSVAAKHTLSQLVRARRGSAREQFLNEIESLTRPALRQIGVRLKGIDLGRIALPKELEDYLSLELKRKVDLGRARTQREAIVNIAEGLNKALAAINEEVFEESGGATPQFLLNLAQILERTSRDFQRLTRSEQELLDSGRLLPGRQTTEEEA
jgi:regulator of protease activity HflC (stomatin/prohibitin superfamily)